MRTLFCFFSALSCFGASPGSFNPSAALAFEARGAEYVAHSPGYALSVSKDGAIFNLRGTSVRMSLGGASSRRSLEPLDRVPGVSSYFFGDHHQSFHLFSRVRLREVYPGIDVLFRANQQRLEYDFEVAAGRDPAAIQLLFDGIDDIRIDRNGDLLLIAGAVTIRQPKPFAYQVVDGKKRPVDAEYSLDRAHRVRFRTGAYDPARDLVIDPQIVFEQIFGGSGMSAAAALARDTAGNLYVTGTTDSTDFATVNPIQGHIATAPLIATTNAGQTWTEPSLAGATVISAMAAAPSAPLTVYAATQAGVFSSGDGGSTWTLPANTGLVGAPMALAVDAGNPGKLYAATLQGVFVSANGASIWQPSANGLTGQGVVTIAASPTQAGTAFASIQSPPVLFRTTDFGETWSQVNTTPPLTSRVFDIEFGSNGTVIAGTFYGILISNDGGNTWMAGANQSVASNQSIAISPGNPNTVFLLNQSMAGVQRSADGGQTFTSVLPAVNFSDLARIAGDPRNPSTVYVTDVNLLYRSTDGGETWSKLSLPYSLTPQTIFISPSDSRVFLGAFTQNSVFVTKWNADGSQVLYSTYLGGMGAAQASAIAVDANGSAYVTGFATSNDFPTTPGALQTKLTGSQDVFIAKLSPDGSQLMYSTLLGSKGAASRSIAVDSAGEAVITGSTGAGLPVTANAFQSAPSAVPCTLSILFLPVAGGDAFASKISAAGNALVYSTYLGGSCATAASSVAIDGNGNAWIAGATTSTDFPVTPDAMQPVAGGGIYDGFLARFNPAGALAYATYVGGAGYDTLTSIALDPSGNVYLTGESGGLLQPATAGAYQPQVSASCQVISIGPLLFQPSGNALVLKLDPAGHSIQGLTYFGANGCLSGASISVDSAGAPWVAGNLSATPFAALPTMNPFAIGVGAGFISKFSPDFTQLLFSTYFDSVTAIAADSSGAAYVVGTNGANDVAHSAFVAKIDPTPAPISLNSIVNVGAPPLPNGVAIAPGEVIQLVGTNMGPPASTPGIIQSGMLAAFVDGVQVTFDGVPVPLLMVSANVIELVAPFELSTKSSTTIQVLYNGLKSNSVQVAVTGVILQVLGVYNQDFSVNSASNPAKAGSTMSLYFSGVGQSNPPSQDGQVNAPPLASPPVPIQLERFGTSTTDTIFLPVTFSGAAPALAAGIFDVNFVAPAETLTQVFLMTGSYSTPINVYVQP